MERVLLGMGDKKHSHYIQIPRAHAAFGPASHQDMLLQRRRPRKLLLLSHQIVLPQLFLQVELDHAPPVPVLLPLPEERPMRYCATHKYHHITGLARDVLDQREINRGGLPANESNQKRTRNQKQRG